MRSSQGCTGSDISRSHPTFSDSGAVTGQTTSRNNLPACGAKCSVRFPSKLVSHLHHSTPPMNQFLLPTSQTPPQKPQNGKAHSLPKELLRSTSTKTRKEHGHNNQSQQKAVLGTWHFKKAVVPDTLEHDSQVDLLAPSMSCTTLVVQRMTFCQSPFIESDTPYIDALLASSSPYTQGTPAFINTNTNRQPPLQTPSFDMPSFLVTPSKPPANNTHSFSRAQTDPVPPMYQTHILTTASAKRHREKGVADSNRSFNSENIFSPFMSHCPSPSPTPSRNRPPPSFLLSKTPTRTPVPEPSVSAMKPAEWLQKFKVPDSLKEDWITDSIEDDVPAKRRKKNFIRYCEYLFLVR